MSTSSTEIGIISIYSLTYPSAAVNTMLPPGQVRRGPGCICTSWLFKINVKHPV